jgi:serine/threonine-protein kinase RsbW
MYPYLRPKPCQAHLVNLGQDPHARRVQVRARAELQPHVEKLDNWMRVLAYTDRDIFAVRLTLEEAVSNALRHGNRGDTRKYVQVRYLVTDTEVLLEVEDQGVGFNPEEVPNPLLEEFQFRPSGRGLFLMRAYMDVVSYNTPGNCVTLGKRRTVS